MTAQTLYLASCVTGLLAYLFLVGFCIVTWVRRITGKALLVAASLTFLHIAALLLTVKSPVSISLESLALFAWIGLLLRALGFGIDRIRARPFGGLSLLALLSLLLAAAGTFLPWLPFIVSFPERDLSAIFIVQILLCVAGLVAVEQLARNTREDLRWRLRYLNIGMGLIFAYGLIENAVALMFNAPSLVLTIIRPTVLALAVPFIVLASLRNRENQLRFNISRQFVFRSGVLIATGTLLMLMGLAGYYVRLSSGELGTAAVTLLATLVVLAIFVVLGSTDVQARIRRYLSRHLYEATYDYREQWARVTKQLTEPNPDFSLEQQAIRSLIGVFDAAAGAYWRFTGKSFVPQATLHAPWSDPLGGRAAECLAEYFSLNERLIDLHSPPADLPEDLRTLDGSDALRGCRFLIPLYTHQSLFGMIGVSEPALNVEISEEDRNLVQLVSREVAGFLALHHADRRLAESQQFDAINRLTTYLVHDVKTTSAQLSLMIDNAKEHKSNPEFIDDMLETVANAVRRMQKLAGQLQEARSEDVETIDVGTLLTDVVGQFSSSEPRPRLVSKQDGAFVRANRDRLATAIGHTLQNAIDATDSHGSVVIEATRNTPWIDLKISDTGSGMTQEFITSELFTPFRSTKGVAGMGIGAYQVREYVREIGGDLLVQSIVGNGSCFTFKLPEANHG